MDNYSSAIAHVSASTNLSTEGGKTYGITELTTTNIVVLITIAMVLVFFVAAITISSIVKQNFDRPIGDVARFFGVGATIAFAIPWTLLLITWSTAANWGVSEDYNAATGVGLVVAFVLPLVGAVCALIELFESRQKLVRNFSR